jgi:Tol biopolymer transport system component
VPLSSGTAVGPYEIVALIGAGGMGEVYRARDSRLGRDVALKVLPAALAGDPDRRERFEREARAASALNHPHICALYDIGHADGIDYLVMELVDGESLADRLARGPLSIDQALRLGIEIADALSRAHKQGIVHRDLKPANVMLTKQGAKLLDFGLARVDAPPSASGSFLPTQQRPLTQAGTVLGTFQYMAPEQLEGGEADARTDIFAFGALLYEAVTGRKAFDGKSQASLISAIMAGTPPPISSLQPTTPPALDHVIRTCLAKDPDERWQTARDLGVELKWIAESGSQVGAPAPVVARRKSNERWAWTAAGVFALASAALALRLLTARDMLREPTRFSIAPPKGVTLVWPRLSPDGRTVAFVGVDQQGRRSIWVRPLGSFEPVQVAGTDGVQRPFWSPDSRYLAFFAGGQLKKLPIAGGPPQLVCEQAGGADGSWGQGVILFDGRVNDPIRRVPDTGGIPTVAVKPDESRKEAGTAWPFFLPDGRHFLFVANETRGPTTMKVGSIDSAEVSVLGESDTRVEYSSGYLFYASQQTLLARPFSPDRRAFVGEPFPVTDRIQIQNLGLVDFSTSLAGDLAYSSAGQEQRSHLVWFDRSGKELGVASDPAHYHDIALSPDETRAAVGIGATLGGIGANDGIWVVDLKRGVRSRLTFGNELHAFPVWSADGSHVAYTMAADGVPRKVVQKLASGAGDEQLLLDDKTGGGVFPTDWSSDGQHMIVGWLSKESDNFDILTMAPDGNGRLVPFLRAPKPIMESNGVFSPDGRWIAYVSNESGRLESYVQSFPPSSGKWQISTGGALCVRWSAGGREIIYATADDTFYSVAIRMSGAGLEIGLPVKLFQHRLAHSQPERNHWTATRDGQRFLLNDSIEGEDSRTVQVVLNWAAGLRKP